MFLNEGEKENFLITERVLESSKKKEKKREGAGERKRDWSSQNVLNEGEKENKRGGRDSGHVCRGEKKNK